MPTLPFIVAVDFDGTIVKSDQSQQHGIGELWPGVREAFRDIRKLGCKIIICTCTEGERQVYAQMLLQQRGLAYDAWNINPWSDWGQRKMFAHFTIDDRSNFTGDWPAMVEQVRGRLGGSIPIELG